MVRVAVRSLAVLAAAVRVSVAEPLPVVGLRVNQAGTVVMLQAPLALRLAVVDPPADGADQAAGLTER